jgi:ElaB/YqjD/DUF883 family membrane-anchored ribosome-binding protein
MSSNGKENTYVTREKLVADLKVLATDVQELIKATAGVVSDKAAEARTKVEESLKVAQDKLGQVQDNVKDKSAAAVQATQTYITDNPWRAVGLGVSVGFLLGIGFAAGTFLRSRD